MSAINFTAAPLVPEAADLTPADWARCYTEDHGFVLTWIRPGSKQPGPQENWPNLAFPPEYWDSNPQHGMGLLLDNGTRKYCSLDLDDVPMTRLVFASLGLDWEEMTAHSVASQGNPDRFRILFLAPQGDLRTKQLAWPHPSGEILPSGKVKEVTVFELRGGHGYQDVLPPSIHPSGQAYAWLPGRAPWETTILPMPAVLEDLWRHWADWKGELEALCPWAPTPIIAEKPLRGRARGEATTGVIAAWNDAHPLDEVLRQHGYIPKGERRWLAPGSSTGLPGVSLLQNGKVFSHHGSDPLNDGQGAKDSFDAFRILEHNGDARSAIKAAARAMQIPMHPPKSGPGQSYGADHKARSQEGQAWEARPQQGAPGSQDAGQEEGQAKRQLTPVSLALFASATYEPTKFVIDPIIPVGALSLAGGHGEIGKGLLTLALACHVVAGQPWAGLPVQQGRVLYLSLEDPPEVILYRLRRICDVYQLDAQTVAHGLTVLDGTEADALAQEVSMGGIKGIHQTAAMMEFADALPGHAMAVIDNVSDGFDGDENSRRQVRVFLKMLARLARSHGVAILALAHIDKTAARYGANGNTYSGSTAWHNTPRSRLALTKRDDGAITLTHEKLNLGKKLPEPISLWFQDGVLVPMDSQQMDITKDLMDGIHDQSILAVVRSAVEADRHIPVATQGAHTAWGALKVMPDFPANMTKATLDAGMARLQKQGKIRIESYRKNCKDTSRWTTT